MNNDATSLEKVLDLLDKWRMFPSYQLERRVDVLFATFLPELLFSKFKKKVIKLLPEFPIRVGDIYELDINKSFRIDYVAVREDRSILFVEFKTDMTSRRGEQDDYLERAKNAKLPKLIDGLIKIYGKTTQKKKYMSFINELALIGWVKVDGESVVNTSSDSDIEIVYIQPTNDKNDPQIISFDDCINLINQFESPINKRFVASLEKWKVNPNE